MKPLKKYFIHFMSIFAYRKIKVDKIYSGTSLQLRKIKSYFGELRSLNDLTYRVHSDFPLLRSEDEFECLLKEFHVTVEKGFEPKQLDWIREYSCCLRGRYLWSTLYIDHLQSLNDLDEEAIREAANDVASRAKEDLKERLTRLNKRGSKCEQTQKLLESSLLDRKLTVTFLIDKNQLHSRNSKHWLIKDSR